MALKFPPPPFVATTDPKWQQINRWLIEIQSILNSDGTVNIGDSPVLTGEPTAPTAPLGTDTTQLATTAFVLANSASTPSTTVPLVDAGTGAVGTSTKFARQDHVHPTDTSRAALVSPVFAGTPEGPTAPPGTNTTQLATTAFVLANGGGGSGSGVAAFGVFNTSGLVAGGNVASVTRAAAGEYAVVFTTPMANTNYVIQVSSEVSGGATTALQHGILSSPAKTVNGFTLFFENDSGTLTDPTLGHFAVVDAVSSGSGVAAWVNFAPGATPTINGSANVASVTHVATGVYTITFSTPFPDAHYTMSYLALQSTATLGALAIATAISASSVTINTFNTAGTSSDAAEALVTFFGT